VLDLATRKAARDLDQLVDHGCVWRTPFLMPLGLRILLPPKKRQNPRGKGTPSSSRYKVIHLVQAFPKPHVTVSYSQDRGHGAQGHKSPLLRGSVTKSAARKSRNHPIRHCAFGTSQAGAATRFSQARPAFTSRRRRTMVRPDAHARNTSIAMLSEADNGHDG